ncbi:restriction endonuclease subunit S [Candidatus Laterigemmans baculatus]|uniref:restriction endonuclease subunit S n=1 Tax=Candidatus Laterigemmans baculatus TaxID=2770505 RepID=UPI0013DAFEA7|nr:restriction endonuclease subunit S [Candidatus Laterigemmans baculatus]
MSTRNEKNWRLVRFGTVTKIASGMIDPRRDEYADMLHIGPENIQSGTGQISGLRTAKEENLVSGKYRFDKAAIVFSKIRPNLNKVCAPSFSGVCSADTYPIWVDENYLDRSFLFQYMLSPTFVRETTAMSARTGLPKINRDDLNSIKVPLPPLPEQQKLAAILSNWDRAVELTEKLIAAKQRRKQALMQQLLAGKARLPGFTGAWKLTKAGELFSRRSEPGVPDLPVLSVTIDRGLIRRDSIERKMESTLDTEQHLLVRSGDIVYNMMRMWQGASGLAREDGVVSPAYVVLKPMSHVDPLFASYFFKLRHTVKQFQDYSFGLTKDRLRLYYKDFAAIPLRFPPPAEQRQIACVLSAVDREIDLNRAKVARVRRQKKGLMQQLLTGKLRVSVDAETVKG